MQYRILGKTGLHVSTLSFGASSLGAVFHPVDENEGICAVRAAIDCGINLIDVSPAYGETKAETVLGKALTEIPRDKYILATKAGKYSDKRFDFSRESITQSVHDSFKRLNVDYVDIVDLHDIEYQGERFLKQALTEGIEALQRLKEQGKIRFYGFTAYPISVFAEALGQVQVDTILSHNHYSLNDTLLLDLLPLIKATGVGLINASPLSSGLLTKRGPSSWHPATIEDKQVCQQAVAFCEQQGVSIEKLAVQFSASHSDIPTTLVSTSRCEIITNNVRWVEEPLDLGLVREVQAILAPIMDKDWNFGNLNWN